MRSPFTSFMSTAACGALVGGASMACSGITPGLLVDSNQPAVFAPKPAHAAGGSTGLHLQSIAPI